MNYQKEVEKIIKEIKAGTERQYITRYLLAKYSKQNALDIVNRAIRKLNNNNK